MIVLYLEKKRTPANLAAGVRKNRVKSEDAETEFPLQPANKSVSVNSDRI